MSKLCLALALAFAIVFGSACAEQQTVTEALVVVDSDLMGGSQLSELRVQVFAADDSTLLSDRTLAVAAQKGRAGAFTLPLSFSLTPGSMDHNAEFRLVATGRGEDDDGALVDVVERQVVSAFRAGVRTRVDVYLQASCLGVLCREDGDAPGAQSCVSGTCEDVPAAHVELAEGGDLGGYIAPADGGVDAPADGGDVAPEDSGPPDDEELPACQADDDCAAQLGTLTPEGCAVGRCKKGGCVYVANDADGDGHGADTCRSDRVDIELGDDCDDKNPKRSPDAWDGPAVADEHPSSCDEIDNDCDGEADDERPGGKTCECDPVNDVDVPCSQTRDGQAIVWPAGTPVGSCRYGRRSCTEGGVWSACSGAVAPRAKDSCDVADDDSDCDGQRNEGCPCVTGATQKCGTDVGNCKLGIQSCRAGRWGNCSDQVAPKPTDSCEPDDDASCNGIPNEGCECVEGTTSTCAEVAQALGVCAARPVTCKSGKWDRSLCQPSEPEACLDDQRDEDCDGLVNERPDCECTSGRSTSCRSQGALGSCAMGTALCTNGKLGTCSTLPQAVDTCVRHNDDTCNGKANEGCACLQGEMQPCTVGGCPGGMQTCDLHGAWGACEGPRDCPVADAGL